MANGRKSAKFKSTVALDVAVAAVVVCKQQTVSGDEFSGAARAEEYDGILQGRLVDAVNIFRAEPEAFRLHVADTLRNQRGQPHAFIRPDDGRIQQ